MSAQLPSFDYDYQSFSHLELRPLESLLYSDSPRNWIYNLGASSAVTRAGPYPHESDCLIPVLMVR